MCVSEQKCDGQIQSVGAILTREQMRTTLSIFAIVAFCAACSTPTPQPAALSALVVPPDATNVRRETKPDGTAGVTYAVQEEFPADALLGRIRAALTTPDWQPLPNDWLNPDLASSHTRGWTDFDEGRRTPPTHVHQWSAQWRDSKGNVVSYSLRYDSKIQPAGVDVSRPDNSNVSVTALWVPERVAKQMMSSAGRGSAPAAPVDPTWLTTWTAHPPDQH